MDSNAAIRKMNNIAKCRNKKLILEEFITALHVIGQKKPPEKLFHRGFY